MKWKLFALIIWLTPMVPTYAQPWSGILDPSRATDWSQAGVPGGIPNRTTICQTVAPLGAPGAPAPADPINNAIQACNNDGSTGGKVVQLQAGTYYLSSAITTLGLQVAQNVTLRGMGPDKTIIEFDDPSAGSFSGCGLGGGGMLCVIDQAWLNSGCFYPNVPNLANWTANFTPGTTQITLDNISGSQSTLAPGVILFLDQHNPPSTDFNNYVPFATSDPTYQGSGAGTQLCNQSRSPDRCVNELHYVTSVTGTGAYTVTITPPIAYPAWNAHGTQADQPQAYWCGTANKVAYKDGVENLSINNRTAAGSNIAGIIQLWGAAQSWVKNVQTSKGIAAHVSVNMSTNIEVRDSYMYGEQNPADCLMTGVRYGIVLEEAGFTKVENNILHQTCTSLITSNCAVCVHGYNFTIGDLTAANGGTLFGWGTFVGHSGGTHLELYEGNISNAYSSDHNVAHGTNAGFYTIFRNYFSGQQTPGSTLYGYPVMHQAVNRVSSFIGNVLGNPDLKTLGWAYQSVPGARTGNKLGGAIWSIGFPCAGDDQTICGSLDDPITFTSSMRWGNYDYVTGTSRFLASEVPSPGVAPYTQFVPATQTLPNSFYLPGKASWFGNSPWPAIGPDVTGGYDQSGHVGSIPARNCYLNVMHGPTNGSGEALTFNADNCYGGGPAAPARPAGLSLR